MKPSIRLWQLCGFAATSLLGTVLHFLYEWLGEPLWIAPFSGVNESTFEHMKLLFWPMLLFAVVQSFFFSSLGGFWQGKLLGILLGLGLIPLLFYTYNGAIGKSPDFVNIGIFFIAAAVAYLWECRLLRRPKPPKNPSLWPKLALGLVALLFVAFTFFPPKLPLFRDPITGAYGI